MQKFPSGDAVESSPESAERAPAWETEPGMGLGLTFRIAHRLDEVVAAWRMVYMAYRRNDLIEANPQRLHTAPQACGRHAAVITGGIGPLAITTLTALADGPAGLPLDRVYGSELTTLRRDGRRLIEVGLFADRRRQITRTANALFQLMRFAFFYGLSLEMTDFIIGVHPRHARFYTRAFGFEPMGAPRVYPAVNNRPVVLLRGNLEVNLKLDPLHPALDYFVQNPLSGDPFSDRFGFEPDLVDRSPIGEFLRRRELECQEGRLSMPA